MIKNLLKISWRSLWKHKLFTAINISGLACGLATAMLLMLWVQHERSYDRFHDGHERIYRITDRYTSNGIKMASEDVPAPLSVFAQSIPEVESIVRVKEEPIKIIANANRSKVMDGFHIAYVDTSFLEVFNFKLIRGNEQQLFGHNNSVAITQSTAKKFFGTDDVLGNVLQFKANNFTITAVLDDFPDNSSIHFDAFFPMGFYGQLFTANGGNGNWATIDSDLGNYEFQAYVKLHHGAHPVIVGAAFTEQYEKALHSESEDQFHLQSLTDIHLIGADGNDTPAKMVRIFLLVAILVLAIAAVNYINLTSALALDRIREVGIRKVVGASKTQLFMQSILETTLVFFLSLVIAIGGIILLIPVYNQISGKELRFSVTDTQIWAIIGYAALGTLLTASIYPALLLSTFNPLKALKSKIISGVGSTHLQKILVVFQFSVSLVLIVATLVISRQLIHIRTLDLGYEKGYVFTVPLPTDVIKHIDAVKNELINQQAIIDVSLSGINDLSNLSSTTDDIDWQGKPANSQLIISQATIDQDFIPTMKIQLLEGSNFTGTPADSGLYIVNEAAVREMGLMPPYVGQPLSFHNREGTIAGVVKDFNYKSLRNKISPLLFFNWWNGNTLYVRTTARDISSAITAVETQYKKYAGDIPFSYNFIDKHFEEKYASDKRAGLMFNIFAGIALFISCLGLLGLSTYTVRRRVKEIGIRKVLGANIGSIVQLLSKGSVQLVIISIIIASPFAWWIMNRWLEDFAYRIEIAWWMFALAGLVSVIIALLAIGWQAIRAALANPVRSLQEE